MTISSTLNDRFVPAQQGLAKATTRPVSTTVDPEHAKIERQAQRLVGQAFFGTILKQMHDSPFRSKLMDGGRGGEAFSSLYDQRLVDRMSRGAGKKLVNSIVRRMEARKAYQRQAKSTDNQRRSPELPSSQPGNNYENVRIHVSPALGT
jgi:Rod binding domain-containing protein